MAQGLSRESGVGTKQGVGRSGESAESRKLAEIREQRQTASLLRIDLGLWRTKTVPRTKEDSFLFLFLFPVDTRGFSRANPRIEVVSWVVFWGFPA